MVQGHKGLVCVCMLEKYWSGVADASLTDRQTTEYSATQLASSIEFKLSHAIIVDVKAIAGEYKSNTVNKGRYIWNICWSVALSVIVMLQNIVVKTKFVTIC